MEKSNQLKAANFESSKEFLATLEKATFIENPLNELASSPTAIVYYGTPCCTLKCCIPCNCLKCKCDCGDFFAYNTLTVNGDVQKYLFKNIARLNCSIFCTDLINRFDYCKSISLSSFDQYSSDAGVEGAEMVKENNCVLFGICSYFLDVFTKPNNKLAGIVQFRGCCSELCNCSGSSCCSFCKNCSDCCYDFYYCCDILSPNKQIVYTIYLRKCCLSCFPIGCCNVLNFTIKAPDGTNVGEIEGRRNCCSFMGICGANYTYTIQFPGNSTPELKLTIINAVTAIDIFYV
jgi:hypothetical protein